MTSKYKVYEIGCKDHGHDEGWEVWIAVPEGCNIEQVDSNFLYCKYLHEYASGNGVDFIIHKDVAS